MSAIRAVALVAIRRGSMVLLAERRSEGRLSSYRPAGGTIEPGERAIDAARREIMEELGIALREIRLRGVLENIFTIQGELGHEVVFIYEPDWTMELDCGDVLAAEESDGSSFECRWHRIANLAELPHPLYPEGLLELLTQSG